LYLKVVKERLRQAKPVVAFFDLLAERVEIMGA
jgi:hypothetical protein